MLEMDIQFLKGVGPKRKEKLNKLNIFSIEDLLSNMPYKYEDRRTVIKIKDINAYNSDKILLKVKIVSKGRLIKISNRLVINVIKAQDSTGYIDIKFFNQKFLVDSIRLNEEYYLFGSVNINNKELEINNPDVEAVNNSFKANKIVPVYNLTYNVSNNELTKLTMIALNQLYDKIEDVLPDSIINEYILLHRKDALKYIHFPKDGKTYKEAKKSIAIEKLVVMQLGLMSIKSNLRSKLSAHKMSSYELSNRLLDKIPYSLTNAQLKVINEIKKELLKDNPMNRLVQGDVGSGKTVVAIYAMLIAVNSGYQACMMAPTEILAMQHYDTIKEYLNNADINLNISLLTGSTKKKAKDEIIEKLMNSQIDIVVGTHALIEKNIEFNKIGLVVTDEQHRFGVRQRALLSSKGENPHLLVMTATPIPRTLALIVYGDLDISIINEMPKNRKEIKTYVLNEKDINKAYNLIKKEVLNNRQAYIVAPLVEESETLNINSATEIFNELKNNVFYELRLGLLHGKLKNSAKEEIINKFYKGEIDVLVSTTVIEVGVNVPNSTIMLIQNAERFGLAQLHQLRGRVGRGEHQSYCILVNGSKSDKSNERLNILKESNDGFLIAQEDLKIRGPGDFFGTNQHGLSKLEIQNILSNVEYVNLSSEISKELLKHNPMLIGAEYNNLKKAVNNLFKDESIIFN